MARPGVTYQDIAAAAQALKGQGTNITIENVRAILGTGSISTINTHLRKWKEAQDHTHKISIKENLPEELVALIQGLWERVITQSAEQFAPLEEKLKQDITLLTQDLEKYKNNNMRWQKLFDQWQQEKTKLTKEKLTLEQALEFGHKEHTTLTAKNDTLLLQLQNKQDRIDELHRLHKQTQDNLEHYRESAREQRIFDQQQHEQQKQQLQNEIKTLQEKLVIQRNDFLALQQEYQATQKSHAMLKEDHMKQQSLCERMQQQLTDVEKIKDAQLKTILHWQHQHNELQNRLDLKISQFFDIQAENKILQQQQSEAKQSLTNLQNQNKLLIHEKWELAQEKSHLEGRLKQMSVV